MNPEAFDGAVEEYAETVREIIPPWTPGEAAKGEVWYAETDFDMDPTRGMNKHMRSERVHGIECGKCGVPGCNAPLSVLSDYGYYCWGFVDEDGEPEWVPLCWEHARPIYYLESDIVDPKTGIRATDGLEDK